MALLEIDKIDAFYGNIQALRGVSLTVEQGEIVTLIGSNGAGKTTTLRTIAGMLRPRAGHIRFDGTDLATVPAHRIVYHGIAHAPEGRRIFPRMTVKENLELGAYSRGKGDLTADYEHVFTLFPRLKERITQKAGTLSGGEQQMLAIGRALMTKPRLLMLDEPSLGLAPMLVEVIFQIIREINATGVPILLVEQNAHKALETAHRGYVLETGRIVKHGTGRELLDSPDVQKAYLGI
ncbi:MAG TPA: ABC transporter ATP-binding protein [Candidatus Limnocylindria bacterium]|nr:ABC transporter ATP-binding protein [Candidatus Limnocylindria bacterium]